MPLQATAQLKFKFAWLPEEMIGMATPPFFGGVWCFAAPTSSPLPAGSPEAPPYAVACSGEGKGGTLSVLRRSIVPDVITEVPLPGGCLPGQTAPGPALLMWHAAQRGA